MVVSDILGLGSLSNRLGGVAKESPAHKLCARWYQKLDENAVQCQLCPRHCIIPEGKRGFCRVRENHNGTLYSLVYGRPCVVDVGPIEKAPIFHFIPGHKRLCVATPSCNLRCKFCQNWHLSQQFPEDIATLELSPSQIVELAKEKGLNSISFTYTEPVVFYEYIYDICKIAKEQGLKTSIVSNGYINPEPLRKLVKLLDAVKIDLKAFTDEFYQNVSSAELSPVLNTLKVLKEEGVYFEIVNLVIPTLNDNPEEIKAMCNWINENLGPDVPLHFTRFFPAYKLTNLPPTPIETLEQAYEIAKACSLRYVYIGNVYNHRYESTYCPNCHKRVVHRVGFSILRNNIVNGRCKFCGTKIPGVWE